MPFISKQEKTETETKAEAKAEEKEEKSHLHIPGDNIVTDKHGNRLPDLKTDYKDNVKTEQYTGKFKPETDTSHFRTGWENLSYSQRFDIKKAKENYERKMENKRKGIV